ncbi:hypothetical protein VNO77_20755 [Canavalia gladiata]|uniref:Uncharacterized protein n=1 Tax=Canavalia gladiata TaxID=3824 RepID=A0AAN9LTP9_CANGL
MLQNRARLRLQPSHACNHKFVQIWYKWRRECLTAKPNIPENYAFFSLPLSIPLPCNLHRGVTLIYVKNWNSNSSSLCGGIVNWIFMSSTITGEYFVSCDSGNKNNNNNLFCWILLCLLPKFLGTPFAYINFLLIQAIDRSPSAVGVLGSFGVVNL